MLVQLTRAIRDPDLSEGDIREAHAAGHLDADTATALVLRASLDELRRRRSAARASSRYLAV
jgi:hypothetical protein